MESCIPRVSCKGFALTLQETQSIHDSMNLPKSTLQETRSIPDSMNLPKLKFFAYIYILL